MAAAVIGHLNSAPASGRLGLFEAKNTPPRPWNRIERWLCLREVARGWSPHAKQAGLERTNWPNGIIEHGPLMSRQIDFPGPVRVIMRDAIGGRWLQFSRPREIVTAFTLPEVVDGLKRVEAALTGTGLHAAGFVGYEAAPAFDEAFVVKAGGRLPLLWFGLYERPEEVELPAPPGEGAVRATGWKPSVTDREYRAAVRRIKELIGKGDTYQVNYTYRLRTSFAADPWGFFLHLAAAQESPYSAFIDTGEWVICSASPELFFRLDGQRIECRPMKGTAARGLTFAEDLAQGEALQASEKDRAENVMIVDMVRHDLGRVAETGSVTVTSLFAVEKYPTVWQMTSTIEAKTRAALSDIFGALFPPASITGAPKVRTMEIIAQLESSPRLIYTGAIGFAGPGRRAQFNVAIRTVLLNRRSGRAEYGVGGGIIWDSQAESEWQECLTKSRILDPPAPTFDLLETMLWVPGQGYFLLELHLRRLDESAAYFGFRVNLMAVRRELEAAASRFLLSRQKVRVRVNKQGGIFIDAAALPEDTGRRQRVSLAPGSVHSANPFLYHKTTNRCIYEAALAGFPGYDDVLLVNEKGEVTESTIANVIVEIEGKLFTPPVCCGLLPGVFRSHLLEQGEIIERTITAEQLLRGSRVFLVNSVRGRYEAEVAATLERSSPTLRAS
jgi:para-aminobenzoate synthetase/4-amino-4-deoxychorismate lyase